MSILIPTKEFVFQAEGIKGDVKAVLGYSTQIPDNKSGIVSLPNHHELGGTIIEQSSNGDLILEFSAHPIPKSEESKLARSAMQLTEQEVANGYYRPHLLTEMFNTCRIGWINMHANEMAKMFLEDDGWLDPKLAIGWSLEEQREIDDPYCFVDELSYAQALITGKPNGHPAWDGAEITL
jgi:hypothetical protein